MYAGFEYGTKARTKAMGSHISDQTYLARTNQVDIYPSYEWKVPVKPKGKDYFGYSTHSDYSVVPNEKVIFILKLTLMNQIQ